MIFSKDGRETVDGLSVLNAAYLIPFKAKAWVDLTNQKEEGKRLDSKNIKKHKNDVFRLMELMSPNDRILVPEKVYGDLQNFISSMQNEDVDAKQLGLTNISKEQVLKQLKEIYTLK